MTRRLKMLRKTSVLVLAIVLLITVFLSAAHAQGNEAGEDENGGSVKLVVTIAAIWLAIMAAVITVVVITRRKAGEQDRQSKEG